MLQLFVGREVVELPRFHLQEGLCVLSDDVNDHTGGVICKMDGESVAEEGLDLFLAGGAVVDACIFLLGHFLAALAGVVEFLPRDVHGPAAKLEKSYSMRE